MTATKRWMSADAWLSGRSEADLRDYEDRSHLYPPDEVVAARRRAAAAALEPEPYTAIDLVMDRYAEAPAPAPRRSRRRGVPRPGKRYTP